MIKDKDNIFFDLDQCLSNAYDFYEIACEINKKRNFREYKYMAVFATNLSFSCELYFKAILFKENNQQFSHKLNSLFTELSDTAKSALKTEFNNTNNLYDLSETLMNCDNVFEDFRYLHECNKNKKLFTTDLFHLVHSLRNVCQNLYGFKV